jgi:hypothetical protein
MKYYSYEIESTMHSLRKKSETGFSRLTSLKERVQLINQIGDSENPNAVIFLLEYVFSPEHEISRAASRAISRLFSPLSNTQLEQFYKFGRVLKEVTFYQVGWPAIQPELLTKLRWLGVDLNGVLELCCFHPNGYVRETALRLLDRCESKLALPIFLLRLNDWVPEIRTLVEQTVLARLYNQNAPNFIQCLPIISQLNLRGRIAHRTIPDQIRKFIQSDACYPHLLEMTQTEKGKFRRNCFLVLLEATPVHPEILDLAAVDYDPFIRYKCLRVVREQADLKIAKKYLDGWLHDRYSPLRAQALRLVLEKFPEKSEDVLSQFLFDPHPGISLDARVLLNRISIRDFAGIYREAIHRDHALPAAIRGLGQTGSQSDIELIKPFLQHAMVRIRREALTALYRVDKVHSFDILLTSVGDCSPSVSTTATFILLEEIRSISASRIWDQFLAAKYVHSKMNCLRLISHLAKWDGLNYLLAAVRAEDDNVAKMAHHWLADWLTHFNTSFLPPTKAQRESIQYQLLESMKFFSPEEQRQFISILDSFG